jgi:two-component system, LuxR family, sensor kinase FixL
MMYGSVRRPIEVGAISLVTVLWSAVAGAALLLGALHLAYWSANRRLHVDLVFAVTTLAFVGVAATEIWGMHAATPQEWGRAVWWCHVPLFFLVVGVVAFVHLYLGTGRAWLAWSIVGLRSAIFAANFAADTNFNLERVDSIERVRFLGDTVTVVGDAVVGDWQFLGLVGSALLVAYVLDACVTLWRKGGAEERRRATVIGVSILVFTASAGTYVQLVLYGVLTLPLLITPMFLAPLAAMTYELSRDLLRASTLAREVAQGKLRLELAATAANLGLGEWESSSGRIWATHKARQLFGLDGLEDAELHPWLDKVHPEDRARVTDELRRAINGTDDYVAEFRVRPDGRTTRWLAAHGRVLWVEGGRKIVLRGVVRDITESRLARDEAQELRRELAHTGRVSLLGQLASSLAHELSQPLGAILRNTEAAELMLMVPDIDREELQEVVADIRRDDHRAGLVIERMRSLLKGRQLELLPVALDGVVEDVLALVHADSDSRHVKIECQLETSLPKVQGDRVHLSQVLLNLILNAMDAVTDLTPDRRHVTVGAARNGHQTIELYVADAGDGIPPEAMNQVFEPFFTTKPAGMGMGLAITRSIVERHGGQISVSNRAGRGARFSITLPIDAEAA